MKKHTFFWILGCLFCLAGTSAFAKEAEGLSVTPSQLTVTGMRGATETRTLLLRSEKVLENVKLLTLDLPRSDGNVVLPMSAIQATLAKNSVDPQEPISVMIEFSMKNVPSGEFKGELLIGHDEGTLTLPVTVKVKDPPWGALIVLFLGVALSLGVSSYRARGKPRDEVLVRAGQVRAQMRGDKELHEQFRARIKGALIDVEVALQAEKWTEAQEAVEKAEAYWAKWRKGRSDWLAQFSYQATLQERLDGAIAQQSAYIQSLRCELEGAVRNAPELEEPYAFRQKLDALAQQLDRFLRLSKALDAFEGTLADFQGNEEQREPWRLKALDFRRRLDSLKPEDEKAYKALQNEIETALTGLRKEIEKFSTLENYRTSKAVRDFDMPAGTEAFPPAPMTQTFAPGTSVSSAQMRLLWFHRVSYAIAVLFLAGSGFGELYVGNAIFGANAWGDYLALLAWGFGAEATRASVTDMIKGWGVER